MNMIVRMIFIAFVCLDSIVFIAGFYFFKVYAEILFYSGGKP